MGNAIFVGVVAVGISAEEAANLRVLKRQLDEDFIDEVVLPTAVIEELDVELLLCDEFTQLGLIHASLADTRLVTTPTLLEGTVSAERIGVSPLSIDHAVTYSVTGAL
jgi:hypothetical protein